MGQSKFVSGNNRNLEAPRLGTQEDLRMNMHKLNNHLMRQFGYRTPAQMLSNESVHLGLKLRNKREGGTAEKALSLEDALKPCHETVMTMN